MLSVIFIPEAMRRLLVMVHWTARLIIGVIFMVTLTVPSVGRAQATPAQKLVEAAKKDGELVYYTTMTLDQSKQVVDRFEKKYGVKVTLFRTGGGPLLNKIFTEARGGRYDWDVVVGRGEMVLPLMERKLVASYHSPEAKMIDEQLVDKEAIGRRIT
jgi:ABC-type thiamine transport system substrate-binding protein